MEIYQVGGAVRDELLGLPVQDRDYVVVGATPEQMLAQGFKPVGKDFPVFLHPVTREEYALARTERKTAPGYKGFVFHADVDVTLEQDLARRDLTINAIAKTADGRLIDPFGGVRDLRAGVLRHVGPAFVEDPVRILRVARLAARFGDFEIAPETLELMRAMTDAGEADHLIAERVWQEISRGLMEARPSRMVQTLRGCGALARILPELDRAFGISGPAEPDAWADAGAVLLRAIDIAAFAGLPLSVRFATLLHDLDDDRAGGGGAGLVQAVCERLRVPNDCRGLAALTVVAHVQIDRAAELDPPAIVHLLERCDALRRPDRFRDLIDACDCHSRARAGNERIEYGPRPILLGALEAVSSVDAGAVARVPGDPALVAERVRSARVAAVAQRLAGSRGA